VLDCIKKIVQGNGQRLYKIMGIISGTGATIFMLLGGHATLRVMVASGPKVSF
jgi:hypothetical protein